MGPLNPTADWIFCQVGAREHYVLPAQFHREQRLARLYTDIWAPPASPLRKLPLKGLADRYNPALADAPVTGFSMGALAFEAARRLRRGEDIDWPLIMAYNAWFERRVAADLPRHVRPGMTVFSYSYAARGIFRAARKLGARTVLGQIDPAITEDRIVNEACARRASLQPRSNPPPPRYWELWREECDLASQIVVNSEWSRTGLIEAGVAAEKISVIPLAYDSALTARTPRPPQRFDATRPLRVLFLGALIVRKGIAELLEAAALLAGQPVEFLMVGNLGVTPPPETMSNPAIRWIGHVGRGEVGRWYNQADVFILPSLSDGFGLTMIEAQSHGLPVIASRHCGDVVQDGVNGLLLPQVSGEAIAAAVRTLLDAPDRLAAMSSQALHTADHFKPERIAAQLAAL